MKNARGVPDEPLPWSECCCFRLQQLHLASSHRWRQSEIAKLFRVMAQVIGHESLDEVVAVIVPGLHPQI